MSSVRSFAFAGVVLAAAGQLSAQTNGEAIYRTRCAGCHDQTSARIPPRDTLQKMPASRILRALDFGAMMNIAYPLKRDEREAVSRFLGTQTEETALPAAAYCPSRTIKISLNTTRQWNGWSPATGNSRFQPAVAAGLSVDDTPRLELKWAFAFAGDVSAVAQPTVIDRTLFVGSASGIVHALDAGTGCAYWIFQANGPVRSAIVAVPRSQGYALLFTDQVGWLYALEAETGRLIWKKRVEEHEAARLTAAPVVHDGVAFVPAASWEETRSVGAGYACCTFRGSVTALRVRDGAMVWKRYTIAEESKPGGTSRGGRPQWGPSGAGVWASPTIDVQRGRLYVTTGDNYSTPATATSDAVMALDLASGRIVWSRQMTMGDAYNSSCGDPAGVNCPPEDGPDFDFGSSPLLVRTLAGRDLVVAGQKSGLVYALDPDRDGEIVWQVRVGKGGVNGGVQWGMASDGRHVYAAVSDVARIPKAKTNPADLLRFDLNPQQGGGLTAVRLEDGQKVWYAPPAACGPRPGCSPAQSAAVTAIPGVVFSGSLDGHLRAFAAGDGRLVWDVDTARDYATVNGVAGRGGSLDGPGAVVVGGMLFVNSGYSRFGGMSGNVLLAFAPPHGHPRAEVETGARLFQASCATCHGPKGDTVRGVSLFGGRFKRANSDEQLVSIIIRGIAGTSMPPSSYTADEAGMIVAYMRGTAAGKVEVRAGDADSGRLIFEGKGRCTTCHSNDSRLAPSLEDVGVLRRPLELERSILDPDTDLPGDYRFVRVVTKTGDNVSGRLMNQSTFSIQILDSSGQLRAFDNSDLKEILVATGSSMPSYRDKLDAQEVADLVAYLAARRGGR